MKKTLLTKTLIVLMTLALVVGVYAVKPNTAEATVNADARVTGNKDSIAVGEEVTFTASATSSDNTAIHYTWPTTDPTGLQKVSGGGDTNSITYKAVSVPASPTITVACEIVDGDLTTTRTPSDTVTIEELAFSTSESDIALEQERTISLKNVTVGGTVTWTANDGGAYVTLSGNGTSATIRGKAFSGSTSIVITANDGTQTATYTLRVLKKTGAMTAKNSTITIFTDVGSYDMDQQLTTTYDKSATWTVQSGSLPTGTSLTADTGMLQFGSAGGTFTLRATMPDSDNYSTPSPVDIAVNVRKKVTVTPSASSTSVNTDHTSKTITAYASNSSTLTYRWISGTDSIATLTGPTISGNQYTYTITGGSATGTRTLRIETSGGAEEYGYTDITVRTTLPVPVITAVVDDRTLGKGDMSHLHITVDGGTPGQDVTITRSNIRTYAKDYDHHDKTYEYTKALDASGCAKFDIYPQYNGDTYYRISYSGATSIDTATITVSGYKTMPQTGPDYTAVYVVSGLCLLALAAAVTMNVRKKKHEKV